MVFASISIPNFSMWRYAKSGVLHLKCEWRSCRIELFRSSSSSSTSLGAFGSVCIAVTVPFNFIISDLATPAFHSASALPTGYTM